MFCAVLPLLARTHGRTLAVTKHPHFTPQPYTFSPPQDWCISRQLWWGHRIPVWYVHDSEAEAAAAERGVSGRYVVARNETEAHALARERHGQVGSTGRRGGRGGKAGGQQALRGGTQRGGGACAGAGATRAGAQAGRAGERKFRQKGGGTGVQLRLGPSSAPLHPHPHCAYTQGVALRQEEDVLDTWFSSGLWPFSTLGWPNTQVEDYKTYYPTQVSVLPHTSK